MSFMKKIKDLFSKKPAPETPPGSEGPLDIRHKYRRGMRCLVIGGGFPEDLGREIILGRSSVTGLSCDVVLIGPFWASDPPETTRRGNVKGWHEKALLPIEDSDIKEEDESWEELVEKAKKLTLKSPKQGGIILVPEKAKSE